MPEEKEEKKTEEQIAEEAKAEKERQWDKEKQRADQAEANYQKLAAEKETITEEYTEALAKATELEEQLAAKADAKEAELAKMDGDLVDKNVIANFEKVQSDLKQTKEKLAALEKKATEYADAEAARQDEADKEKRREAILSRLDGAYSPKYRNDAMKMANDKIAKGEAQVPADSLEAYLLLEPCYKKLQDDEASEKDTTKKKVPVDTGIGGFAFGQEDLKEGSLDEVTAQMKKEGKFKGITFPVP